MGWFSIIPLVGLGNLNGKEVLEDPIPTKRLDLFSYLKTGMVPVDYDTYSTSGTVFPSLGTEFR
jgi:hypothetical protein